MYYCYILYSKLLDKFYIGFTREDPDVRLERHLIEFYGSGKFTAVAKDWTIFMSIPCPTEKLARAVESHIKKMKSKKYIKDLKQYPDMVQRLLSKCDLP